MSTELQTTVSPEIIQKLVLDGDLGKMDGQQKLEYYNKFCQSLGLNPLTQPFQLIKFQGKEKLYATKDCTEQLRKIHGVGIIDLSTNSLNDVFIVTAKAQDKTGKLDAATGAVNIKGLSGDALANAMMKAETKAKRRVTLSICGLGMLDESELETMPQHTTQTIDADYVFGWEYSQFHQDLLQNLLDKSTYEEGRAKEAIQNNINAVKQMTEEKFIKIKTQLEANQLDPIDAGLNYNQGDISKKMRKEIA